MPIYLDNAATSFPKPDTVYAAMDDYNRRLGTAVGRGAYRAAIEVRDIVDRCRKHAAELLGAASPDRVVFTFNGTDGLNLALHGLLKAGDHVVTSVVEHNSVLRPLRTLQTKLGIEVTHVPADATGRIDPADIRAAITPQTRLIALVHASNVSGAIQPILEVGRIAREAGVLFLVDAAQTAGILPLNLKEQPIDLLACPGHKGLLGPLGTGLLYIAPGIESQLDSLRQGGTGSRSEDDRQPDTLPEKYEPGNHNAPGLVGLAAALDYLQSRGLDAIRAHEMDCAGRLLSGLSVIDGVEVYGPTEIGDRVGVISFNFTGYDPQTAATILDENFEIQTRSGLHCAPGAHRSLGTFELGGTVRMSVGPFTTLEEIDAAIAACTAIAESAAL